MRLLFIIYESSVEGRVIDILNDAGAPGYTRFTGATGRGKRGRREGSPVWPGLNDLMLAAMPGELVPAVLEALEGLEAEREGRLAVKVFSVPADEFM